MSVVNWKHSDKYQRNIFLIIILALIPAFNLLALKIVNSLVYQDSDFFTFWLAGWMRWAGQDPYSIKQWVSGHQIFGADWIPNPIFPYPIPLSYLLAPLGLLPLKSAYIIWIISAEIFIVGSLLIVLHIWKIEYTFSVI